MLKKALFISLFCVLFSLSNVSEAENYQDLIYANYVNDFANLLSAQDKADLNRKLYEHFASTTNQVAVVTVTNMSGDYIENFAFRLFEKWGIGDKDKNNGVLFLISKEDRKMRIEVGYGLEPLLTDGKVNAILENYVRPEFKNQNYATGIKIGTEKILQVLNSDPSLSQDVASGVQKENNQKFNFANFLEIMFMLFPFAIIFGGLILQWLLSVLGRTKSWWLGGVFGATLGGGLLLFAGLALIYEIVAVLLITLGFVIDYFVSKNYKEHKQGIKNGPPDWWGGGTWGPGGSSNWSSSDSFGGFGGGMSGGGGGSSDW